MDLTDRHPRSRRVNYPIPITKMKLSAEEIVPHFGVTIQLLTDEGRTFDNRLMEGLSEVY